MEGICEKPPIGVAPHWYFAQSRIKELSEAITRYSKYKLFHINEANLIKYWANEIILQCEDYIKMTELHYLTTGKDRHE